MGEKVITRTLPVITPTLPVKTLMISITLLVLPVFSYKYINIIYTYTGIAGVLDAIWLFGSLGTVFWGKLGKVVEITQERPGKHRVIKG